MQEEVLTMKYEIYMVIAISIIMLVACQSVPQGSPIDFDATDTPNATLDGLHKFDSAESVIEYLENSGSNSMQNSGLLRGSVMEEMAIDSIASKSAPVPSTAGASVYSETNVQVEGVDEADIVKNDGKYIYTLNQDHLVIVDAYPADDASVVFDDELKGRPRNLFVNSDKLIVFTEDDGEVYGIQPYDFMPRPRYVQQTHVIVYDISDRSKPVLENEFELTGNYFQARMIGDYVYFVVRDNVYYYDHFIDLPNIRLGGNVVAQPEIYYFDNPEDNYVFHTVASFNINDDDINAKTFLMGYSDTMYVSEDNIYIAYQKQRPWRYYDQDREERFFQAVVPLLPDDVQKEILQIQKDYSKTSERWMRISVVMQDMYDSLGDDARALVEKIDEAVQEYNWKSEEKQSRTVIHKIAINKGNLEYEASGEVSGHLLNQFSFDEYKGNLRVATTTQLWSGQMRSYNNVFVLDEGMDIIGSLTELAEDESIYSTRFMGDRLYMVTFERIDPLFVIDLSNPRKPEVLGELKIPGFSDYLHPYDENHIIGIGKQTADNRWGGVSIKGLKLALFDVSRVKNPRLVDQYEIGSQGTDSEVLRDHKAFLFDKEKNLMVIPIREVLEKQVYDNIHRYYRDRVWQGAYVFTVTDNGFDVRGKVSHQEGLDQYYDYYSGNAVRRALYMDDVLYTVSGKKIKMNDLENLEDINEIDLPHDDERWYWY